MHIKTITKLNNPFVRFFINACNAIVLITALISFIYTTSLEIFIIFLQTSYGIYFISIIILIISIIIFSIIFAFTALKKFKYEPPFLHKIFPILVLFFILLFVIIFSYKYISYLINKTPSAAYNFTYKAGPFIQFGPYKNNTIISTSNSMIIWWFDPVKRDETIHIKFGENRNPNLMKQIEENHSSDGKRHEVLLQNLVPSTRYYFYIPNFDEKIYSFYTGPREKSRKPIRFLFIADTGNTKKLSNSFSYYDAVLSVADQFYKKNGERPAFKLHCGDITKTGIDLLGWKTFFEIEKKHCSDPSMLTIGNHEFLEDFGSNRDYFLNQPRYYSFDYGNVHFLSIHPFDGFGTSADGPILSTGKEQYEFIKSDLAKNTSKKWLIVTIHVPILSTGDYNINEILIGHYFKLFKKYKVDLVLSGHDHNFDSFWVDKNTEWGGTFYIVSGTGGSKIDAYIMRRKSKRWKTWYHDRTSDLGLYQSDEFTNRYHLYGELSWGFTDIKISSDTLTISYYRWLDFDTFLKITGQNQIYQKTPKKWKMIPLRKDQWNKYNLSNVTLIKSYSKTRKFNY